MSTPILSATDITVTYPDGEQQVTAVNKVTMEALPGKITAVVGESGSGKSTLLSVAAGLTVPQSGHLEVAGVDVMQTDDAERSRLRREEIGMVFQSPNLLNALTVREQLLLTHHLRGHRPGRKEFQEADALLARVGLVGFGDRRIHQLSGGQRQRVNIARAITGSPSLLLADEPTSALDAALSRQIVELLRSLTDERGLATVLVTHDRSLLDLVDDVVTLRDGAVVGS